MARIINGKKFDFEGQHYCGKSVYPLASNDLRWPNMEALIPDNIFELSREEIAPIMKAVMHEMNIQWSSVGGVPNFPEKFGEYTRLAMRGFGIFMKGRGWSFTIYRERHAIWHPRFSKAIRDAMRDETMTDEEKRERLTAIGGEFATAIS